MSYIFLTQFAQKLESKVKQKQFAIIIIIIIIIMPIYFLSTSDGLPVSVIMYSTSKSSSRTTQCTLFINNIWLLICILHNVDFSCQIKGFIVLLGI